jgi:hypothetical protein
MSRSFATVVLGAFLLFALGCATTTFESTWKNPDAQVVNPAGKVVAAVFVSADESRRRAAEDALVRDLNARGAHGVAAYTLLPPSIHANSEQARERFKAAGVEGVVTMRVISSKDRFTYTPGYMTFPPYYDRFSGYWGYGWGTVYEPGYLQTDTIVSVETLVYSLTQDKLLWAGTSRTTNPTDLDKFVNEIADAAAKAMTQQGLLTK